MNRVRVSHTDFVSKSNYQHVYRMFSGRVKHKKNIYKQRIKVARKTIRQLKGRTDQESP